MSIGEISRIIIPCLGRRGGQFPAGLGRIQEGSVSDWITTDSWPSSTYASLNWSQKSSAQVGKHTRDLSTGVGVIRYSNKELPLQIRIAADPWPSTSDELYFHDQ